MFDQHKIFRLLCFHCFLITSERAHIHERTQMANEREKLQLHHEFFKTAFFGRPTHNMPLTDSCSGLLQIDMNTHGRIVCAHIMRRES